MDLSAATPSEVAPAPPRPGPDPSRHRAWWRPDWRTAVALAVVALVVALPLRALFHQGGSPMEEGFMLVFPERVLAGDVPHRDFLHLYGPGSLWVLAGVYELFGTSLAAERVVGLVQQIAIILGVFAVARPFGRTIAAVCATMAALLSLTANGLVALAWNGGVALALLGLVAGLQGRRRVGPSADRDGGDGGAGRWFVLAGILGAGALLYRPDLVVAVVLAYGATAWRLPRGQLARLVVSLGAVLVAGYGFLLVRAGPGTVLHGLFFEPVFDLRDGRRLPVPPSWDHYDGALAAVGQLIAPGWSLPALTGPQQIVVWFFLLPLAAVAEVAYGAWRSRADPSSWRARCLLAVGLLGLGMLPQALQRPDATHLAWVSCVPLALLPLFVAEAVAGRRPRRGARVPVALGAVVALVVLFAMIPHPTVRIWADLTRQSAAGEYGASEVTRDDRNFFYIGADVISDAAQGAVDELDRRAEPGDRLFVGTADLRLTPYSDAYLYYLFPELTPATRYIEMDPGVANAEGSGLADDVASADWLILSHVWDPWDEPNESRTPGSDAPNEVVARSFCVVDAFGEAETPYFLLYQRCR
ncbi:hypothetical protein [Iamia sp.]|uniref:hypothetical protein n=1 Tax=Iamia sp. TaxID=2722710 RepID=UPI002C7E53EF|nr:hypothetical protein [Iamia sp.]HXH56487.1 hypothetical protein [Iamia sp.]